MNARPGTVRRAARAFALAPDTRALKRELQAGNPYAIRKLEALGLTFDARSGIIRRGRVG